MNGSVTLVWIHKGSSYERHCYSGYPANSKPPTQTTHLQLIEIEMFETKLKIKIFFKPLLKVGRKGFGGKTCFDLNLPHPFHWDTFTWPNLCNNFLRWKHMHVVRSQKSVANRKRRKNKVTLSVAKSLYVFEVVQTIFHMIPCVKLWCHPGVY